MLEKLPDLGFDIGKRAIKVDDRIADQIITVWKEQEKKQKQKNKIAEIRGDVIQEKELQDQDEKVKEVKVPTTVSVRDFAVRLGLPVNEVLKELMNNGVLASMNELIDYDTASIVGEELGFKIIEDEKIAEEAGQTVARAKLKKALADKGEKASVRPPIVVVMGHVDHGKTKILDTIRKEDVVAGESGGITQHIGAYQVHRNGGILTFIDTPGHEAFTAMRSRGARVADVAILVIAADDGVQPQTKEAIKIIKDAKLPFVVAINKIDLSSANVEKIKSDLSQIGLQPEDWGGNVTCVEVSATEGTGIEDLLDTVILMSEMDKDRLLADSSMPAIGTIIESHIDKGEGPVATLLVQIGTLKIGDILAVDNNYYGKVRSLKDYKGDSINEATPGTPSKILGLKFSPGVGEIMEVAAKPELLNKKTKKQTGSSGQATVQATENQEEEGAQYINLIVKADVLGSADAIIESLAKLETGKIKIKIVSRGLGVISEADVLKAEATGAQIIGFHVKTGANVLDLAREKDVEIKFFDVIYHLIEDIEKQMSEMKAKEIKRELTGKLQVLKVFRSEAKSMIFGGRVIDGTIYPTETVVVVRNNEPVASGKINRLEVSKDQVDKVSSGTECGLNYEGDPVIEEGDVLEFYRET